MGGASQIRLAPGSLLWQVAVEEVGEHVPQSLLELEDAVHDVYVLSRLPLHAADGAGDELVHRLVSDRVTQHAKRDARQPQCFLVQFSRRPCRRAGHQLVQGLQVGSPWVTRASRERATTSPAAAQPTAETSRLPP